MRRLSRTINFREKEKEILDQIIGSDRYDSRIRPAGMLNDTSKEKMYFVSFSNILSSKSSIYNVRYIFIDAPVKIKINLYVRSISRIDDVKMVIKCI